MDFAVGDRVILLSPTEENRGGWRTEDDGMDMYIGDVGVVKSVFDHQRRKIKFEVHFNTRYRPDGEAIRDYWYCKPEWLKLAKENVDDCAELDSMFREYGGECE